MNVTPTHTRETRRVQDALAALLPPLEARLQRRHLGMLALRLPSHFPPRYKDPAPLPEVADLLGALCNTARQLEAEREEASRRLEQVAQAGGEQASAVVKRQALKVWLTELDGKLAQWSGKPLLRKYVDLDSLRAQYARQRLKAELLIEVVLKLLHAVIERELEGLSPSAQAEHCLQWLHERELEGFLNTRCLMGRPATRALSLQALALLIAPLPDEKRSRAVSSQTLRALFRCLEVREDKWVQLAAAQVLGSAARGELHALLLKRLLEPVPVSDDFVVRRGLLRLMPGHLPGDDGLELLARLFSQQDPAESVRMQAVETLAAYPGERAARLLKQLERGGKQPDSSPRVRAVLAITWRRWLSESPSLREQAQAALLRLLLEDEAELVRRTALEEGLAYISSVGVEQCRRFAIGLDQALRVSLARPGLSPKERTRLSDGMESLYLMASPERWKLTQYIQGHISGLSLGRSFLLPTELVPDEQTLGRILAHLTRDDFGLYAHRTVGGMRITRGEHFTRRLWRIWHELRHRAPNKRQGFIHTRGRAYAGELRAHPGSLAEITATTVPGERLLSEQEGAWGRYLPLLDDLLSMALLSRQRICLFSAEGMTEVYAPATLLGRLRARAELSRDYERLNTLRRLALSSAEPEEQRQYLERITGLGYDVRFVPHDGRAVLQQEGSGLSRIFAAAAAGMTPPEPGRMLELAQHMSRELFVRLSGGVTQLALLVLALLLYMVGRGMARMHTIRRARAKIPLVVGGWGTRGKSGTERLKAALFQGMGYEVLVKTTGCEAMVIHALPDSPAMELFLYRPYDKATIWEQYECIRMAAQLEVQVFLYECMALQPRYVQVIQEDWSQDDVSTLTNAYPDHEDIQGPAGVDVAWCIGEFIRRGGKVFTTEEQMLPVLRETARVKDAQLIPVSLRHSDLISQDFLERFPYQEHPRNIALVLALGQSLGFEPDKCLIEMADKVVPDIGVLKAYPWTTAWGRHMQFVSGNSANERTGFMSNWNRMGFHQHAPAEQPGHWYVTVVNNRADRVARSQVFAEILVRDIAAHRHVLIGTNISGLMQYIESALERYLDELQLLQPEDDGLLVEQVAERRRQRFLRYVSGAKLPGLSAESLLREVASWLAGAGDAEAARTLQDDGVLLAQLEGWLEQARTEPELALEAELEQLLNSEIRSGLQAGLERAGAFKNLPSSTQPIDLSAEGYQSGWVNAFARALVRMRRMREVQQQLEAGLRGELKPEQVNQCFRQTWRALFLETVVPLHDPALTGDQIIRTLAQCCPPGAHVHVMGTQNIKGTGLDFVYRWASVGAVEKYREMLRDTRRSRVARGLTLLREHPDYGLLDVCQALEAVERLRQEGGLWMSLSDEVKSTHAVLKGVLEKRLAKLEVVKGASTQGLIGLQSLEQVLEPLESVRRRDRARQISEALVAGLLSHERAAAEMRKLNKEQKGGWLKAALQTEP